MNGYRNCGEAHGIVCQQLKSIRWFLGVLVTVLIVAFGGTGGFIGYVYGHSEKERKDITSKFDTKVDTLTASISSLSTEIVKLNTTLSIR